jgi:hypothetical protein
VKADFAFEDMSILYTTTLKPVTEAYGSGSYANDNLVIQGERGKVKDITLSEGVVTMEGMSIVGGGTANIQFKGQGPLKTALEYISDEPINMDDNLSFAIDNVDGQVDANVRIKFPTVKGLTKEDFDITVDGTVTDTRVPNIVKGLPLTGGPFNFTYQEMVASLSGDGRLAERPITFDWQQNLKSGERDYEMKLEADLTADAGLRQVFGIDLDDFISGPVPVDISLTDYGVNTTIEVDGSLGPATVALNPFGYYKPAGVAGTVKFTAKIDGEDLQTVESLSLNTRGLGLSNGTLSFREIGGKTDISRGKIPNVTIGETELAADFEITPANVLKVIAKGPVFDLNPFLDGRESSAAAKGAGQGDRATQVFLTADQMLMKNNMVAENVVAYVATDKAGELEGLELDAAIGNGKTVMRFKPDAQTLQRNLFLEASDAGSVLRATGLYENVVGGILKVYGEPIEGIRGDLSGNAQIDDFRVRNAPVLAQLINTMSLPGILGLLNNQGLAFARLESDFEWRFQPGGDMYIIKDGRTSGASLGLTFAGVVDTQTDTTDINGTIVPMSELNNIIGNIPLIGDILTGGGALVAATYSIKGPTEDPRVFVNPLSVLAPGIIRRILFEEGIDAPPPAEPQEQVAPPNGNAGRE